MVQRSSRDYVPAQNSANNVTMADVIGNKTDASSGGATSIFGYTKACYGYHDVPLADSADNAQMSDVIGNKSDTSGGTSIFSNVGKVQADLLLPSQNAADNNTVAEVIGNKTDTKIGTSLVALHQQQLDRSGLPSADSANNNVFADVIGNKTDTKVGTSIMSKLATILANSSTSSSGTFSYLDAGAEQTIVEVTPTTAEEINIWLDLSNLTQNGKIRFYYKIDGSNYREVEEWSFTVATDSDGFNSNTNLVVGASQYKITYEEDVDEGAARDIPYLVIRQLRVLT